MHNMQRTRQPPKWPCSMQNDLDRLSNLPGHIIDRILSYLSIRDAVRTSIISSNWRYKWATLPNLIFDKDCCPSSSEDQVVSRSKLVNIIDHVFVLHFGIIHKFKLSHKDLQAVTDIDRWILRISRSSVEEFILEIWKGQRYKIPSSLYSCKHLIHLELFNCLLSLPPAFKGFQNLKSLDLQHITMTEDAFENLIAWCPLLERLTLMNFDSFSNLKIHAPNLQFFDIGGDFEDVTFEDTNLLSIISIGLYVNVGSEFSARQTSSSNMLKFFAYLPLIKRLEVQSYFLKYLALGNVPSELPVACLELNYLSMRINFNDIKENKAAFCLLKSSPNLSELEMLARPEEEFIAKSGSSFWEENNHIDCMFHQLRVVKIIDICGIKPELDFVKFLLANSSALEKLTVKPATLSGGLELLKELLRYRRASVQAEVIYLDP
ncbi:F-box/FBD/LRR-repeat protein At1g13570 isoform X1 [Beta vulgaris subsp. vulgaris]|uniref:F-box/FBD/LRR-repeat protein At1g13570 isoform X1 n=1 Tax=Beta vulgaris subsp. vulgaris TaxID=3555 RepID=UPI0020373152|nr:F-box/FBD/LRR-repeat protein At1g13570 isoform X1 [Beta vulgaris subsp. vulgaris]XP_048501141.1 F-box/FBD/LRR-repeat protein At1g13570 isoform X1 [Beta vulgaris subsp. vulgaris]